MGLIIRPKFKLRALHCRILTWGNLKAAYRSDPIVIEWANISKIYIPADPKKEFWIFYSADGFNSSIQCFADEINDLAKLKQLAELQPQNIGLSKFAVLRQEILTHFKLHFQYGAFIEKFILGIFALTFMFYQFKYFGSLMIQKYQFLIKASCNEHCAEMLWSTSVWWIYGLLITLSPLILILFYKRINDSILRSKDVHTINTTRFALFYFAAFSLYVLIGSSSLISTTAAKYSKIIAAYSDGTLETKLSQKIEMASKREFQGDIDEIEEVEFSEDVRNE